MTHAQPVSHTASKGPALTIRQFFIREDASYTEMQHRLAARGTAAKVFYLGMHLLPGVLAWWVLGPWLAPLVQQTGIPSKMLQYDFLLIVTFGWHMLLPVMMLRFVDGLSWREIVTALSLERVDWKGLCVVLPLTIILFTAVSLPYMKWVTPILTSWVETIPALRIPPESIFQTGGSNGGLYSFSPFQLAVMFIGNFLGEELYYRGYLQKKIAFLGGHAWWVGATLFTIYHFWQAPQTWPLIGLAVIFGAVMAMRKNTYVVIALHVYLNLFWGGVVHAVLS